MTYKVKVTEMPVDPKELLKHPLVEMLGIEGPDAYETKLYGDYKLRENVLVTSDMRILANGFYVDIAIAQGLDKIPVDVIEGIEDTDIPQLVNLKHRRLRKKKVSLVKACFFIEEFWKTDAGKIWSAEIPGADIRSKLSYLTGYSEGTIQYISQIYKHDPDLLQKVDNRELTLSKAIDTVNTAYAEKKSRTVDKAHKKEKKVVPIDTSISPDFVFQSLTYMVKGKKLEISKSGETITAVLDNKVLDRVNFSSKPSENGEAFYDLVQLFGNGANLHIKGSGFDKILKHINNNNEKATIIAIGAPNQKAA